MNQKLIDLIHLCCRATEALIEGEKVLTGITDLSYLQLVADKAVERFKQHHPEPDLPDFKIELEECGNSCQCISLFIDQETSKLISAFNQQQPQQRAIQNFNLMDTSLSEGYTINFLGGVDPSNNQDSTDFELDHTYALNIPGPDTLQ